MKMKSGILVIVAFLILSMTFPFETLQARPPRWAPAHGYRARTRQVYFPEQNFYYDTHRNVYIYLDNGRWVTNVHLPIIYALLNLGNVPKVELEINSNCPYNYNRRNVEMYRVRNNREYNDNNYENNDDHEHDHEHDRRHGNKHNHDREDD